MKIFASTLAVSAVLSGCLDNAQLSITSTKPTPTPTSASLLTAPILSFTTPQNIVNPTIYGSAPVGTTMVRIYSLPNCGGTIQASATPSLLGSSGVVMPTVASNAITTYSANAILADGTISACSTNYSYTEDSITPSVTNITSSNADGTYGLAAVISIQVTFTENVIVNTGGGTPSLLLETGATDHQAIYVSGTGTNTLTFNYTVQANDASADLDMNVSNTISLNGGSITDTANNITSFALPTIAAPGSLGFNKSLVIETTPPTNATVMSWVQVSPYNGTNVTAQWVKSASGDLADQKIQYYSDSTCTTATGGLIDLASNVVQTNAFVGANGNSYTYKIVSIDFAGNSSTSPCSNFIAIDTTPPASATTLGWVQSSPFNATGVTATWTKSISGDLVDQKIQYYIDGTCTTTTGGLIDLASNSIQTNGFVGVTGNTYSFKITSLDGAGNTTLSGCSSPMVIDTTPPAAATSLVWSQASPFNLTAVTASWTKSVAGDLANQKIQYYIDGSCTTTTGGLINLASNTIQTNAFVGTNANTYTYKITSFDNAGNSTVSSCSSALLIDTVNPSVVITSAPAYINNANKTAYVVAGTCTDSGSGISGNVNVNVTDGTNSKVTSGPCSAGSFSISVDATTGFTPGALLDGSNNINITANASDLAGNTFTTSAIMRTKDTVAPGTPTNIVLTTPASSPANTIAPAFTVTLPSYTAGDSVSIFTDSACSIPALKGTQAAGSTSVLVTSSNLAPDGFFIFWAQTTDAAGNSSTCSSANYAYQLDTIAPTIAITSAPAWVNTTNSAAYVVSGTCGDGGSGITGNTITVSATDGTHTASGTSTCSPNVFSVTLNMNTLNTGLGNITITASGPDSAGNIGSANVMRSKDITAPLIAITSAPAWINIANNTSYTVSGTCTDTGGSGITGTVNMMVGDGVNAVGATPLCTGGTFTATFNILTGAPSPLVDGINNIIVTANVTDVAGNFGNASALTRSKDTIAPTISSLTATPANSYKKAGNTVSITVGFSESVTVSGSPTLALNTTPANSATTTPGTYSNVPFTYTVAATDNVSRLDYTGVSALSGGTIVDQAGNPAVLTLPGSVGSNGIYTANIVIDTVAPVVTVSTPVASYNVNNKNQFTFTISGTCSENGLNVYLSASNTVPQSASSTTTCIGGNFTGAIDLSPFNDISLGVSAGQTDLAGNTFNTSAISGTKTTCQANSYVISTNTPSWSVPANCTYVTAKVWGAGGGSGGSDTGYSSTGAGGAGAIVGLISVDTTNAQTQNLNMVVGTGGGGGMQGTSKSSGGGGGGGGSGIKNGNTILIAAGGGGGSSGLGAAGTSGNGGAGGGSTGSTGSGTYGGGGGIWNGAILATGATYPASPPLNIINGGMAGASVTSGNAGGTGGTGIGNGGNGSFGSTLSSNGAGCGGGGGGLYGGSGGGAAASAMGSGGGGGGGGVSGYVGPVSGYLLVSFSGAGATPGNSGDADWGGSAGNGGPGASSNLAGSAGTNGKVVIKTYYDNVKPTSPPGSFTILSSSATSITASWSAATDNAGGSGIASYQIALGTNTGLTDLLTYEQGNVGSVLSATLTNFILPVNTTVYPSIRAIDFNGNPSAITNGSSFLTPIHYKIAFAPSGSPAEALSVNIAVSSGAGSVVVKAWGAGGGGGGGSGTAMGGSGYGGGYVKDTHSMSGKTFLMLNLAGGGFGGFGGAAGGGGGGGGGTTIRDNTAAMLTYVGAGGGGGGGSSTSFTGGAGGNGGGTTGTSGTAGVSGGSFGFGANVSSGGAAGTGSFNGTAGGLLSGGAGAGTGGITSMGGMGGCGIDSVGGNGGSTTNGSFIGAGGGGGGYYGGGGGGSNANSGGGGGGGSSFSISLPTYTSGSGVNPGNYTDADRTSFYPQAGGGGSGSTAVGTPGAGSLVVLCDPGNTGC